MRFVCKTVGSILYRNPFYLFVWINFFFGKVTSNLAVKFKSVKFSRDLHFREYDPF
jgi:hypothetical protein